LLAAAVDGKAWRMSDVSERVRGVVGELLGLTPADIPLEARFMEDLGADSLEVAEIVMGLESEFGVAVPDNAPEFIKTVGDAVAYITERA
jgi:acyl carrier protein